MKTLLALLCLASVGCVTSHADMAITIHRGPIDMSPKEAEALVEMDIRLFREYPYLMVDDHEREMKLLEELLSAEHTILILVHDDQALVAAFLATPVNEKRHPLIVRHSEYGKGKALWLWAAAVDSQYQRKGLGRELIRVLLQEAVEQGYTDLYGITVVRSENHPFKPENSAEYVDLDAVWTKLGGTPTDLTTVFNWPTRCGTPGNEFVAPVDNMVRYWHKKIA